MVEMTALQAYPSRPTLVSLYFTLAYVFEPQILLASEVYAYKILCWPPLEAALSILTFCFLFTRCL
jgi:hypothetical protein